MEGKDENKPKIVYFILAEQTWLMIKAALCNE